MTTTKIGKGLACALAALSIGAASAQITKVGSAYQFRMKFVPGRTTTYTIVSNGSMQGQVFSSKQSLTQKILKIVNGVGTLQGSLGDATVVMNGKTMQQPMPPQMKNVSYEMDSRGRPTKGNNQQTAISLPEKPITVGTSWTASTSMPGGAGMPGGMQMSTTYKFVGFEKVNGINTAKILGTLKSSGRMSMTGSGFTWLDPADGSLVKSSIKTTMTMGQNSIPMTILVTRK